MAKTISITIDDDKELQSVIIRPVQPLAAELAVNGTASVLASGTSTATATATYAGGQPDVTADVSIDL